MTRKLHSDLSQNQTIREAIRKIALRGLVDPSTNTVHDTGRITGYVCKIHSDESDELFGTVDVQEYQTMAFESTDDMPVGLHEGVLLSAMQNNMNGMVIIPKLYSEVTIVADPESHTEYVSMFSHVDIIQLDSHDTITVGVREREPFDESDEESPDVNELEETGVFTQTTYKKNSIVSQVQDEDDKNKSSLSMDGNQIYAVVGDAESEYLQSHDKIQAKHDKAELELNGSESTIKFGNSKVKVEDGTVYLGSDSGTDDAVLGGQLADILMDIVGYISQIKTTTQLGPQPPLNMAQFIALKAKINSFKSSHSGFLTKKVQVQK